MFHGSDWQVGHSAEKPTRIFNKGYDSGLWPYNIDPYKETKVTQLPISQSCGMLLTPGSCSEEGSSTRGVRSKITWSGLQVVTKGYPPTDVLAKSFHRQAISTPPLVTNQTTVCPANIYTIGVICRNFPHYSSGKEPTRSISDLVYMAPFRVSGRLVSAITNSAQLVYRRMNCRGPWRQKAKPSIPELEQF